LHEHGRVQDQTDPSKVSLNLNVPQVRARFVDANLGALCQPEFLRNMRVEERIVWSREGR
jgi:hypothetical protein